MNAKLFRMVRDRDFTGVSGTGHVADGVEWPDGAVSIRWLALPAASTVHWDAPDGLEHAVQVHGHGGLTRFVWADSGQEVEL
ncbi:hypothetical protein [Kineosporia babensis]|uniref:Uncharacterized protein n=1 Tax=Kineosporia babensis TaxID=499548 RepID=A0A9X1ST27_9ACTN|nr:hypothetical protein [Kineosporia babensis]MCD5310841.1 hypothetical protein [Kineosporia babensis]